MLRADHEAVELMNAAANHQKKGGRCYCWIQRRGRHVYGNRQIVGEIQQRGTIVAGTRHTRRSKTPALDCSQPIELATAEEDGSSCPRWGGLQWTTKQLARTATLSATGRLMPQATRPPPETHYILSTRPWYRIACITEGGGWIEKMGPKRNEVNAV